MKISNTLILATTLLAACGTASAATALIDFGRTDNTTGSNYNNAQFSAVALNDTTGAATGWSINVTEDGSGNGGQAGAGADVASFPAAVSGFETTALQDSLFANQGGGTNPRMTVVITGLNPTATYDLLFYGSRANGQSLDSIWTLTTGSGGAPVAHASGLNDSVVVDWSGTTNVAGTIEFTITAGADNGGAHALNFGSITEVIPEPSSALLIGLAGIGLVARRRR